VSRSQVLLQAVVLQLVLEHAAATQLRNMQPPVLEADDTGVHEVALGYVPVAAAPGRVGAAVDRDGKEDHVSRPILDHVLRGGDEDALRSLAYPGLVFVRADSHGLALGKILNSCYVFRNYS
jgi:hypothetical protein